MGKRSWDEIESELKRKDTGPAMPDRDAFWQEFRARAERNDAEGTGSKDPILFAGWLKVAAGIAVLAGLIFIHLRETDKTLVRSHEIVLNGDAPSATPEPEESRLKSFEIFTCYDAMLILKDEESGSSIIWIANLDVETVPGEDCL